MYENNYMIYTIHDTTLTFKQGLLSPKLLILLLRTTTNYSPLSHIP